MSGIKMGRKTIPEQAWSPITPADARDTIVYDTSELKYFLYETSYGTISARLARGDISPVYLEHLNHGVYPLYPPYECQGYVPEENIIVCTYLDYTGAELYITYLYISMDGEIDSEKFYIGSF